MFHVPSDDSIAQVRITQAVVRDGQEPELIPRQPASRTRRTRSA